jgi:hypothetical protein
MASVRRRENRGERQVASKPPPSTLDATPSPWRWPHSARALRRDHKRKATEDDIREHRHRFGDAVPRGSGSVPTVVMVALRLEQCDVMSVPFALETLVYGS